MTDEIVIPISCRTAKKMGVLFDLFMNLAGSIAVGIIFGIMVRIFVELSNGNPFLLMFFGGVSMVAFGVICMFILLILDVNVRCVREVQP